MIDPKLVLFIAATATLAGGCKSGPAKVCAKIDELAAQASEHGDESSKEMAQKMKQESGTCITRMKKMEEADPATFAKASTCIDGATQLKEVMACFFQAALGDTKLPAAPGDKSAAKDEKAPAAP